MITLKEFSVNADNDKPLNMIGRVTLLDNGGIEFPGVVDGWASDVVAEAFTQWARKRVEWVGGSEAA